MITSEEEAPRIELGPRGFGQGPCAVQRHRAVVCERAAVASGIRLHFLVKKETDAGTFRFLKRLLYIANSLVDQHNGLEETDNSHRLRGRAGSGLRMFGSSGN